MYNIAKFLNITEEEREAYKWHKENYSDKNTSIYSTYVRFERNTNGGDLYMFSNMSNSGILPILCSFPTFTSAYNFISSFRPGFLYSREFKILLREFLICKKYRYPNPPFDKCIIYKLDNNKYTIRKDSNEKFGHRYDWKYIGKHINSNTIPTTIIIGERIEVSWPYDYYYYYKNNRLWKIVIYYGSTKKIYKIQRWKRRYFEELFFDISGKLTNKYINYK